MSLYPRIFISTFHLRVCPSFTCCFFLISVCEYMSKTYHYLSVFPAIPLGLIVVPGDSDLETCREHIQRLQEVRSPSYLSFRIRKFTM